MSHTCHCLFRVCFVLDPIVFYIETASAVWLAKGERLIMESRKVAGSSVIHVDRERAYYANQADSQERNGLRILPANISGLSLTFLIFILLNAMGLCTAILIYAKL